MAKVPDQDGLRLLLKCARPEISSMKHLWLDAGYQGRGKRWAEEVMGLSVHQERMRDALAAGLEQGDGQSAISSFVGPCGWR